MAIVTGSVQKTIRMDGDAFVRLANLGKSSKIENQNEFIKYILNLGMDTYEETEIDAFIEASHNACNPEPKKEVPSINDLTKYKPDDVYGDKDSGDKPNNVSSEKTSGDAPDNVSLLKNTEQTMKKDDVFSFKNMQFN